MVSSKLLIPIPTLRGWSAELIPIMMLSQRMPGIMAHWRDAMGKCPFGHARFSAIAPIVINNVYSTRYQGSSSVSHLHGV